MSRCSKHGTNWNAECDECEGKAPESARGSFAAQSGSAWVAVTDKMPPYQTWVLLWLVTVNPENSGVVMGQRCIHEEGKFWDGNTYRPLAWISHWQPLPTPPEKPWQRPPNEKLRHPAVENPDASKGN